MSQVETPNNENASEAQLERGTYEIIRNRLQAQADELRNRLGQLGEARRQVFGAIETRLLATERINTSNNCVPRDLVAIGGRLVFGYNVHIGLRSETRLEDVFAVHRFQDDTFHADSLDLLSDAAFLADFRQLYKYYKKTTFAKFFSRGPNLYMVFQVGKSTTDIKAFKWLVEGEQLRYVDARSEHEIKFPPQHEFEWIRTHRDLHRPGLHPHVSVEDRLFVETVGGDLTIKVEDNTDVGEGIYSEPVEDPDQTLDDADIFYAVVGDLILLKVKPYQEQNFRYFVYSEKVKQVRRIDAIDHACVLLPESHGLIFSNGFYLQNGEYKEFESELQGLQFERRIASPNGEDYLYVFYNASCGTYVLLSYNVIEQQVLTPVVCHGFLLFDNGHLVFFKAGEEAQKHHALQVWQTPYVGDTFVPHTQTDSYLYKIGNQDIVRGMAECHEILGLAQRDDSYEDLYVDLVKKAGDVLDSYFWLTSDETYRLDEPLAELKSTAAAAIDEFDKVTRVRQSTAEQFREVVTRSQQIAQSIKTKRFEHINDFVTTLAELRHVRGEVISLRELRYVDLPAVEKLEQTVSEQADRLSHHCVEFLLREESLKPYAQRVEDQRARVDDLAKVAEAKKLEEEINASATELEMLIDIVSNLKIDDATHRTRIVENISDIYSHLNQTRAALKKKSQELLSIEGEAEFHSQVKLLSQGVVNFLDVCDTPEKCDEYLTKLMIQVEELEGRFAEFDDFLLELSEKREEIYSAFDTQKVSLVEARNRRATTLMSAAERILKGIETRVGGLDSINDIHSYFAADLMVEKVRDIVSQLDELEDTVKVGDIQSRLKTIREDAVRQLKDRHELYVDGANVIQFGKHRFSVNVQALDLTTVLKDGRMQFHLTGTNFLEDVDDAEFLETREVWQQELVSENADVYRSEYLAYLMLVAAEGGQTGGPSQLLKLDDSQLLEHVRKFMAPRHLEGYVKGIHDHDAALLLRSLLQLRTSIGMLRYPASARALADVAWNHVVDGEAAALKRHLQPQLEELAHIEAVFPGGEGCGQFAPPIRQWLTQTASAGDVFSESLIEPAAEYLLAQLSSRGSFPVSERAVQVRREFQDQLRRTGGMERFHESARAIQESVGTWARFRMLRNWLTAFVAQNGDEDAKEFVDESAALMMDPQADTRALLHGSDSCEMTGLVGDHPCLKGDSFHLRYTDFVDRLGWYQQTVVPRYERFVHLKKEIVDRKRERMRLEEFKPRVLTSFVRNRLIDEVYLPLIGDNLAKQVGVVGEQKRTDLMGLLLLISPPGYGKTTLMEYVANRLGITFMKINGPAIGHHVTSLDPAEASNASAREEIQKLNLALEMGDNVMIYLDDIQHCNPEFLQKFISLCDGQRKIEGVYGGRTRTYDLRGRKVAVVMAGNPYTESGEKFQIPDMLANRADTYNLGDVIGDSEVAFQTSYLENALTSNPTLNALAGRSQQDVYAVIRMAADQADGVELEGNYAGEELDEFVSVMKKLVRVRDVVLAVNDQYIRSAAQADAYRTEPPFKLQGSYRDMNKIAERIVPIMNDAELETLIQSHYENQAQTLTTGAEANLLKLKELLGQLREQEIERWEDIKRKFQRNVLLGAAEGDDKFSQVVAQMTTFSEGLNDIKNVLSAGMSQLVDEGSRQKHSESGPSSAQLAEAIEHLAAFNKNLQAIGASIAEGRQQAMSPAEQKVQVTYRVPRVLLDVIKTQFAIMESWLQPVVELSKNSSLDTTKLTQSVDEAFQKYEALIERMQEASQK